MKKFGKFVTFVTVAGAAAAGLMYFLDKSQNCKCSCDDDSDDFVDGETVKEERSYIKLNPETKEALDETKEAFNEGKESLKKAVKSAASDIMAKAEDAAKGVGLVKEEVKDTLEDETDNTED